MLSSGARGENQARFIDGAGQGMKKATSRVAGGLTSGSRDRVLDRSLLSQPQTAARGRNKAPALLTRHLGYEMAHRRTMQNCARKRKRDRRTLFSAARVAQNDRR
jgi:hypothetical protein